MVRRLGIYVGVALLTSVAWPVSPVNAGFEFVAPIDQEPKQSSTPATRASEKPVLERSEVDPLLPLMSAPEPIVETKPLPVLPVQSAPSKPTPPPVVMDKKPVKTTVSSAPIAPVSNVANATVVQGFANEIPLVIALQQVIPAQYQYAFADGVNPGEKVDWQGGKPWDQVVSDMVADKGMAVEVSGNVVYIRREGMANTPMRQAPVAMPAPVSAPKAEPKQLLAKSKPLPVMSTETSTIRAKPKVESNLLFDDAKTAELSGVVTAAPARKPSLTVRSDRLSLDDLSIGQPMQLVPAQQPVVRAPVAIAPAPQQVKVQQFDAPVASVENTSKAVYAETVKPEEKRIDVLPKAATPSAPVMSKEPVKDKKILLLDEMPTKTAVSPTVAEPTVLFDNEPNDVVTAPNSDPMMSVMKDDFSVSNAVSMSTWQADRGETLRSVLEKWANDAETSLIWESNYDYPLQTDIEISGSFENAVRTVLDGLASASPRPLGRLHRNQESGQSVLVIETEALTN